MIIAGAYLKGKLASFNGYQFGCSNNFFPKQRGGFMSGIHFDADAAGRGVKAWKDRVAGGLLHQGYHGRSSKNIKIAAAHNCCNIGGVNDCFGSSLKTGS
jgi:hypothetical protein